MAPEIRSSDEPVTRSSVTRRRFDSLLAMDTSRQLSFTTLLCTASIIVKLCVPTVTAIAALQGSFTPPTVLLTSLPIFSHLCFQELATAALLRSYSTYSTASVSNGPSTIFAPGCCIIVTSDSLNSIQSSVSPLSLFSCDVEKTSSPTYPYHLEHRSGDHHSQSGLLQPTIIRMIIRDAILRLHNSGFSNHFSSEALVGALPPDQNSLLIRHYGLYVAPIPLLAQRLRFLPFGAKIPRMFNKNYLVVSTLPSDRKISINDVLVSISPIYDDVFIIIYGIERFFDQNFKYMEPQRRPHQNPACGATNETVSSIKSLEEDVKALNVGEYSVITTFLGMQIAIDETLLTIFSLMDNALVSHLENFSHQPSFFRRNVVPCKLIWNDLETLPTGTILTTLEQGQTLLIPTSSGGLTSIQLRINDVRIKVPNVIHNMKMEGTCAAINMNTPEYVSPLVCEGFHHVVFITDTVLAACVVVASDVENVANPIKLVVHIVTAKISYTPMHAWVATNPIGSAALEARGLHQHEWVEEVYAGVKEMMRVYLQIRKQSHKTFKENEIGHSGGEQSKFVAASRPSSFSLMNHLRSYIPQLFPALNKIVLSSLPVTQLLVQWSHTMPALALSLRTRTFFRGGVLLRGDSSM